MLKQQSATEINSHYATEDPWGYYQNHHDMIRKHVLLSATEGYSISRALDIGCGNGFITESFPAKHIIGIDISNGAIDEAIRRSNGKSIDYRRCSLFDLSRENIGKFDCILVTGVLYGQYIGNSFPLIYKIIDDLLEPNGLLISVHIDEWYFAKFPYVLIGKHRYRYREYKHLLEIYKK